MSTVLMFVVLAGFSYNLLIQFGLGFGSASGSIPEYVGPILFIQLCCLFLTSFCIYLLFYLLSFVLNLDFFEYFLYVPLSSLGAFALETLASRLFPQYDGIKKPLRTSCAYAGLIPAAVFLSRNLAPSPVFALAVCICAALSTLFAILLISAIRERAVLEKVPAPLRGNPLVFISVGLLSLVFTALSCVFFVALGF